MDIKEISNYFNGERQFENFLSVFFDKIKVPDRSIFPLYSNAKINSKAHYTLFNFPIKKGFALVKPDSLACYLILDKNDDIKSQIINHFGNPTFEAEIGFADKLEKAKKVFWNLGYFKISLTDSMLDSNYRNCQLIVFSNQNHKELFFSKNQNL